MADFLTSLRDSFFGPRDQARIDAERADADSFGQVRDKSLDRPEQFTRVPTLDEFCGEVLRYCRRSVVNFPPDYEIEGFWETYRKCEFEEFGQHMGRFLADLHKPRWDRSDLSEICNAALQSRDFPVMGSVCLEFDKFVKLMQAARKGYRG